MDKNTVENNKSFKPIFVQDEMSSSYLSYAMSVIVSRALPDVRDGLKPVHRRIIYAMYKGGYDWSKPFRKSARIVRDVIGKYHPHGDQSVYDALVRLVQDFSMSVPLITGQGNFGSIDGDPPAAMRYTESRLDKIAKHMLEDIEKKTVDFQPNFDDSEDEPTVLPARLPNLLLNGSDGIAVGMATRMPPHNLSEVSGAVKLHVEKIMEQGVEVDKIPEISIEEYMQHIAGPDFPTGAGIHGVDGIYDMYSTGKGRFHIRSKCEVIDDKKGKRIVIHEIPYQVKKADMLVHIAELVSNGTVIGIRDIRDESSKEGIRVLIEVKNNADPYAVLNQLFKSSRLQESYSANMMGILEGRPVLLTLPIILHTYVTHREDVIERRSQFELDKAEARAHVLEGLVKAQERIDDVVAVGKASESREQFELVLQGKEQIIKGIELFEFTEPQSKAIAERRLYQLSQLDVNKVKNEFEDLKIKINDLIEIITSRKRRLVILVNELEEMVEKHSDERRSYIDPMPLSMDREDLIEERAIAITLSEDNYIRHLPVENFRLQNRGGKGLKGVATKEEDTPKLIITCFSKDRLLIFTDQGRVYGLKAWETPLGGRLSKGGHIRNLLQSLREDENIVSLLAISKDLIENPEGNYLMFATKNGRIKRSNLSDYVKINKNGKYAIKFAEGEDDSLITVRPATDSDHVVLVSARGYACRFMPAEIKTRIDPNTGETLTTHTVRVQGRISQGVTGMRLSNDDRVIGMIVSDNYENSVLTVSKYGMGKRTRLGSGEMIDDDRDGYRRTNRSTKGVRTMSLNDGDEIISVKQIPNLSDQLFMLTKSGMMIRLSANQTKETLGKVTKGTRIMELRNKNKNGYIDEIIFVARLPAELIDSEEEE